MSYKELGERVGRLVDGKNAAYGDSFLKSAEFLKLLWPNGIPVDSYGDALAVVRIFDKQMRIATKKHYGGESPYRDISGYGLLGMKKDGDSGQDISDLKDDVESYQRVIKKSKKIRPGIDFPS